VARGGKRKGSGRKPTGKVAMLVRVAPETRTRLEREAKQKRQSLSAVAERHLSDALHGQPVDPQTRALCYLITRIPMIARTFLHTPADGFRWRTDRFDFEALKFVVNAILDRLAPTGAVESGRYGGLNDYLVRIGFVETPQVDEDSPTGLAAVITGTILFGLARPADLLYAEAAQRSDVSSGSAYYALPQAARDLGLTARELTGEDK
jgi:hypothetical protein